MLVTGLGVAEWVFQRVGGAVSAHSQGIGWQKDGEIIAGVAYECFTGGNIYVHQ